MPALTPDEQLQIISKAWGKQRGYCFFPWIDGDAEDKAQRIRGYNEGKAYKWPADRDAILEHLEKHKGDDVYWCPSLFEKPSRKLEVAMDEHCLWADLDEVDPRTIDEELRPTIAWETSPGRYQALWLITGGDIQGASWPGNENQRLTYLLGADHSGWDTTQLLRIPGWRNHKYDYKNEVTGKGPRGKLLWKNGPRYLPDAFENLPEVRGAGTGVDADALEDFVDSVDRSEVWGKVRLKCSKDVRDLVAARDTGGQDRSDKLWQMERDLADAGCTVPEIVAIVRETVWNKFAGRQDEMRQLLTEAGKAVAERSDEVEARIERDREEKALPSNLFDLVKNAPAPVWLVKGILTRGSCGFFAGEPKSYKSWCALDLALSVATGSRFLDAFEVVEPGPVLYIQEEDPLPTIKDRLGKIAPSKAQDKVIVGEKGEDGVHTLEWAPADSDDTVPPIMALVREQVVVSDPGWQAHLDEILDRGYIAGREAGEKAEPFALVIVDTLGSTAGEVDENRAGELNARVLGPLRQLAEKHGAAVQVVHHLNKAKEGDQRRAGQRLLGSVALHAWSESSLYFSHGRKGVMLVETESKSALSMRFEIANLRHKDGQGRLTWRPEVNVMDDEQEATPDKPARKTRKKASGDGPESSGRGDPKNDRTRSSRSTGSAPRVGQGTRKKLNRFMGLPEGTGQADLRTAWEEAGHVWGDWTPAGGVQRRDGGEDRPMPKTGRPRTSNPAALQALTLLHRRKPVPHTTKDVGMVMAEAKQVPYTQTTYVNAFQQLKKLWEEDKILRIGKLWALPDTDVEAAEIEDLIP